MANYTPSDQIRLQQEMSQQLMNKPMRAGVKQGVSTDWGRGLAHMLNQYQGGKMRRDASQQQADNQELKRSEMAQLLAQAQGSPGTSGVGPLDPNAAPTSYSHPDIQGLSAQRQFSHSDAERKHGYDMALQGLKNKGGLENAISAYDYKLKNPTAPKPQGNEFVKVLELNEDGEQVERTYLGDPNDGSMSQLSYGGGQQPVAQPPVQEPPVAQPQPSVQQQPKKKFGVLNDENFDGWAQQQELRKAALAPELSPPQVNQNQPTPGYKNPKRAQEIKAQKQAKSDMSNMLRQTESALVALNNLGGGISSDNDAADNLVNTLRGTEVGHMAESAFATKSSEVREIIRNSRPIILSKIIQASDMSARALDSNRELEFWMSAMADPSKGIHSQMAALSRLNQMLGDGSSMEADKYATEALDADWARNQDTYDRDMEFTMQDTGMSRDQIEAMMNDKMTKKFVQEAQNAN